MAQESHLWVRIKPYNEKRGQKIRRYMAFGMRFEESLGWYKVPAEIELADGRVIDTGAYLRGVRNDNDDPESALAFDVMTETEARKLDEEEKKAAELRAKAVDARPVRPVDMTTADLSRPSKEDREAAAEEQDASVQAPLAQPAKRPRGRPKKVQPATS